MSGDGIVSLTLGIPLVIFLLLVNAICVATEFALVTVRRARIDQLAAEGSRTARSAQGTLRNIDYYIAAGQLGITMASIALGYFGEPVLATIIEPPVEAIVGTFAPVLAHTIAIAVAFMFVTALHIIVGEFVPKTIALEQPVATAQAIAIPITIFARVFGPVVWALNAISLRILKLLGSDAQPLQDDPLTAEDLAYSFESSASAGLISRRELGLTRQLLRLPEIESHELMVPRSKMVVLNASASREEVAAVFADRPLTRYPVYEDTVDNIIGVLDAKRLLLDDDSKTSSWQSRIHPAVIVPELLPVERTLETLRAENGRMAILVDEFGGTAGLITQYDIVRFLANDLPETTHIGDHSGVFGDVQYPKTLSGLVPVSEFRNSTGLDLPQNDAATIGGLVTHLKKRIPTVGDTVRIGDLTLTVVEMDNYRVARVRIDEHRQEAGQPAGMREGSR